MHSPSPVRTVFPSQSVVAFVSHWLDIIRFVIIVFKSGVNLSQYHLFISAIVPIVFASLSIAIGTNPVYVEPPAPPWSVLQSIVPFVLNPYTYCPAQHSLTPDV